MHEKVLPHRNKYADRTGLVMFACLPDNEKTLQLALQGFTTL